MTAEMRKKLERLRAVAPRLNQATTEAGRVIEAVEKFLGELSLGITAEHLIAARPPDARPDSDPDEERPLEEIDARFVYGKYAGGFRLLVRDVLTRRSEIGQWVDVEVLDETPWPSCPRELKLASFARLPALLDTIISKAEDLAEKSEGTSQVVRDLLDAMGQDADAPPAAGRGDERASRQLEPVVAKRSTPATRSRHSSAQVLREPREPRVVEVEIRDAD